MVFNPTDEQVEVAAREFIREYHGYDIWDEILDDEVLTPRTNTLRGIRAALISAFENKPQQPIEPLRQIEIFLMELENYGPRLTYDHGIALFAVRDDDANATGTDDALRRVIFQKYGLKLGLDEARSNEIFEEVFPTTVNFYRLASGYLKHIADDLIEAAN